MYYIIVIYPLTFASTPTPTPTCLLLLPTSTYIKYIYVLLHDTQVRRKSSDSTDFC